MFRIFAKQMNDEEVKVLEKIWHKMQEEFYEQMTDKSNCENSECEDCKYKLLCQSLYNAELYINRIAKKRNLND